MRYIHNNTCQVLLFDLPLLLILFFWCRVICVIYSYIEELVFKDSGVYHIPSFVVLYYLDIGIKLLHLVITCCVPTLKECVEALVIIHHGPC